MARVRAKVEVSLFPFLSVLCCMIGVFMLFLVVILSTRVIEAQDRARQVAKQHKAESPSGADDGDKESIDAETYQALDQRLTELSGLLVARQTERDELERRLETLQATLDAKRDELALGQLVRGRRPIELDKPDPVRPVPDARFRVTKRPVYVEISAEGFVVQPEKKRYPPLTKKRVGKEDQYVADREFRAFLDAVDGERQDKYLLLLIHPNGSGAYRGLRAYLDREYQETTEVLRGDLIYRITKNRIDLGVEPFSQDWQFVAETAGP